MVWTYLPEFRNYLYAMVRGQGTARVEGTPRRGIQRGRDLSHKHNFFPPDIWASRKGCRDKGLGIRMQRISEQLVAICLFYNFPHIHYPYPVTHKPHRGQIVGDKEVANAVRFLEGL
jgi:hypothetical protein